MDSIIKIDPNNDWERYSADLMAIERECFPKLIGEDDASAKRTLMSKAGTVALVYQTVKGVVGECYGMPTDDQAHVQKENRVHDIENYRRYGDGNSFYCYSTAVLPSEQGGSKATRLKRALIAHAKAAGYKYLAGHSCEGEMALINAKLGAKIIRSYGNWYDTGNTHYLSEIDMDNVRVVKPVIQGNGFFCGPASLKAAMDYLGCRDFSQEEIAEKAGTTPEKGTPPDNLVKAAIELGYACHFVQDANFYEVKSVMSKGGAAIVSWTSGNTPHWSPVDRVDDKGICIMDPEDGSFKIYPHDEFKRVWYSSSVSCPETRRIQAMVILEKRD